MLHFLKVFGRGVLVTVLLPVILLIWVLYAVYCVGVFIVMFFKGVVDYFKGKTFNPDLKEDIEARRMILEKEKQEEQAKEALSMMYQNSMTQIINPPQDDEVNDNPYEENPDPFTSSEYESDADYQYEEQESLSDEDGDNDDDLRSN